jgi:hypothetical protein
MLRYKSHKRNVGVLAYETGKDFIKLQFQDGRVYLYDYTKPGKTAVNKMKKLAVTGRGLTTYVNQHVRENYSRKIK